MAIASTCRAGASACAVALGLIAGYFRGIIETAIMRLMDIMLALPSLLLAIVIVAILGPSLINAAMAVVVVSLPHYVRLTRAAVLIEASKDYVIASRVSGAGTLRLMLNTILPNCMAPLIVQATLGFSTAVPQPWTTAMNAMGNNFETARSSRAPRR